MGLINVPNIQNNDAATPDLWNSRYGTIVGAINGNLDNTNIAAGGISTGNLASQSVTTAKIADAGITPPKWTNPYKFSVWKTASFTAGSNTIVPLDTETFDTSNNFDSTTNHRFIAPIDGFYFFSGAVSMTLAGSSLGYSFLAKNGATAGAAGTYIGGQTNQGTTAGSTATFPVNGLYSLVAGDYVELWCYGAGAAGVPGAAFTYLQGFLVTAT